ncbi:MAG: bifunctional phosphopantothenoylcysteine decarboxylase/phosphopantothenate--cysteine ligase CoaBC [Bacteroidales bacterium]|nr:bifunctional phosphopantothenoylcysteine decarboxylase/phosphopantothenate--cysteine ligase CoaBC [Bacteroidales bacterium]MCF8326728.1 bifunctional phosphopantothenoylcysteine decarboxylase/phosphopantothenate--cysteine ligase CoaBC [Bacteroidales bacterium]
MEFEGKKIVIGITGSIAAYKIPLLVRLLKKEGADVQVIMTPTARDFVTPLTLSTLSERPVISEPFDSLTGEWNSHVDLGRWADLMLFAPVSASTMGKMVNAIADNFLVTTYIAAKCPVYFAPAMDLDMFKHPANQANIKKLQSYGNILIDPQEGELASRLKGAGRMEEPEVIFEILKEGLKKKQTLTNKKVLVTAGPTYERIDPVRYIGNFSSGKMGFALAEAFASRGADVTLITGPSNLKVSNPNIKRIDIESSAEMLSEVKQAFSKADILMMSAAVADFKPSTAQEQKIKKNTQHWSLELEKTPDILSELAKQKSPRQLMIGFALETENEQYNASQKLENKKLDMIVLNSLRDEGAGFATDTNKVTLITKQEQLPLDIKHKSEVAQDIVSYIVDNLSQTKIKDK